ncbi:MAG: hemin uptake protein HemP [Planctomycetota bacterium]
MMTEEKEAEAGADRAASRVPAEPTKVIDFQSIANGSTTVLIRLDDTLYTLRRTKNNRLILQK